MQSLESCGSKSSMNVLESRRRLDERALDKEEEDYFNADRYAVLVRREAATLIVSMILIKYILACNSDEEDMAPGSRSRAQEVHVQPAIPNGAVMGQPPVRYFKYYLLKKLA